MQRFGLCIGLLLIAASQSGMAQTITPDGLAEELNGKNNFSEVWSIINRYYRGRDFINNPQLFSEFKKWYRWAWWESKHLDPQGHLIRSTEKVFETTRRLDQQRSAAPVNVQSNSGAWTLIGPENLTTGIGRVDRLAFHPTNPSIIYAGTPASGLWKTTDGGNSWFALQGFAPSLGVSGIVIDAVNPDEIYVLTGDGDSWANTSFVYMRASVGILKSNDGGNTWFKLSGIVANPSVPFYGFKLIQLPDFNNVLIAATSHGIYRSTDFGNNWTFVFSGMRVYDIEVKPGSSNTIYASSTSELMISTDYGENYSFVNLPNPPNASVADRSSIAVSPASPGTLFVDFGGTNTNAIPNVSEQKLYRSDNSGGTFTLLNTAHQVVTGFMCALAVHPQNTNILVQGAMQAIYSSNGGLSFSTGADIHADVHDLVFKNGYLYAACDGGVYRSSNNGANWSYLSNGLAVTQYYHLSGTPVNDNVLIGGAQDNGYILRNNTGVFSINAGGDGYSGKFLNNSADAYIFSLNAGVIKHTISTNTTVGLLKATSAEINVPRDFFPHLEIHPASNNILYAGYADSLRRSTDGGTSWTALGGGGASAGFGFAGGLAVSPQNPDRLYLATGTQLRISNDQGTTQTIISGNPGWPQVTGSITDISCRPNNADEVWVTFSGFNGPKVLYSSNAGATWVNLTGTLPDLPVYCITYSSNGDAYIGNDYGVYVMAFDMNDWVPYYNGLPNIPVTDLYLNEAAGSLKAATFGRGIWQSDLYSNCGLLLFPLTGVIQGRRFYQAPNILQSSQSMSGNYGNEVRYRSAEKIRFTNGFKVSAGAYMRAVIGPCGPGIFERSSPLPMTKAALLYPDRME